MDGAAKFGPLDPDPLAKITRGVQVISGFGTIAAYVLSASIYHLNHKVAWLQSVKSHPLCTLDWVHSHVSGGSNFA